MLQSTLELRGMQVVDQLARDYCMGQERLLFRLNNSNLASNVMKRKKA